MIRYLYAVTLVVRFSSHTFACGQQAARRYGQEDSRNDFNTGFSRGNDSIFVLENMS
jgi:hypothetical protein